MSLQIPKNAKLTPAEAAVEADFSAAVCANLESLVRRYHDEHGPWIDTDRARELCPAYAESPGSRARLSRAVYNPAKALVDEIYRRQVEESGPGAHRRILFTSGGTGAGKSTALAEHLKRKTLAESGYYLLVDGTLSDWEAARAKVRRALEAGFDVQVLHVHQALPTAVRLVVKRAVEMGRVVTLDNIAATHFRSREVLFALLAEFDHYGERFLVAILENALGRPPRPISTAQLRAVPGRSVAELRAEAHALYGREFGELAAKKPALHAAFLQAGSRL